MPSVRIYNDNVFEHTEKFKGKMITIPSQNFIRMDKDEAILFLGQYFPPKFANGVDDPKFRKKLRIVEGEDADTGKAQAPKEIEHRCMKCNFVAKSNAGLASHIRLSHIDSMVDEEAREAMLKEL